MSTVLAIGDTHCPAMKRGYVKFLQKTADEWSVDRVVHIGDLVDWSAISYHEKLPGALSAETEFKRAKRQVDQLTAAFPEADWLIGNHDALTKRKAATAGLPMEVLKSYNELWENDWKVTERFGMVEIDNVIYRHGDKGKQGIRAAIRQACDNFRSTVIGHLHANAGVDWFANEHFRVFGLSTGTGVDCKDLSMRYGQRFDRKPLLGCGVIENGTYAHFIPWALRSR